MKQYSESTAPGLSPENFINREISTLDFQERVLALAEDESTPLLERVKFIAIVGNNLDEFYMVRVAGYFQKLHINNPKTRPDGITPSQLLRTIHERVAALIARQRRVRRHVFDLLEKDEHSLPQNPSIVRRGTRGFVLLLSLRGLPCANAAGG